MRGGKITKFKQGYAGLTVRIPLMFLSEWRKFPWAPCLAGKIN